MVRRHPPATRAGELIPREALKTGFESRAGEIDQLNQTIVTRDKTLAEERKTNRALSTKLTRWKEKDLAITDRETAVTKREAEANKLQMQVEAANQRVFDHQEMMRTVFKNPVLQRATCESKQGPVATDSGYPTMMTETNSHTEKETIEW